MRIFILGTQNAPWVFSCFFSPWEHYYLHAVKRGRQLEKLQLGNNTGKPGKLYVKQFFFSAMIARNGNCSKEKFSFLLFFLLFYVFLHSKGNFLKLICLIHILMDKCVKTAGSKCCRACVLRDSWFIYVLISFLFLFLVCILHQPCHTSSETELNSSLLMVLSSEISVKCISLFFFKNPCWMHNYTSSLIHYDSSTSLPS